MSVAASLSALEDVPWSVRRRVRTLGHALTRLRAGLQLLHRQSVKGTLAVAFPVGWLDRWGGAQLEQPLPLPVDSNGGLALSWQDEMWQVIAPLAAEAGQSGFTADWLVALLLLQLPALKSFWRQALRSNRFTLLRRVMPQVWPLDLTPLPPGATIGGLGLPSWQDLPRLLARGRRFELVNLETREQIPLPADLSQEAWLQHLAQAASGRWVVIEQRSGSDGMLWATWATQDGWVDLAAVHPRSLATAN